MIDGFVTACVHTYTVGACKKCTNAYAYTMISILDLCVLMSIQTMIIIMTYVSSV